MKRSATAKIRGVPLSTAATENYQKVSLSAATSPPEIHKWFSLVNLICEPYYTLIRWLHLFEGDVFIYTQRCPLPQVEAD